MSRKNVLAPVTPHEATAGGFPDPAAYRGLNPSDRPQLAERQETEPIASASKNYRRSLSGPCGVQSVSSSWIRI